MDMRKRFQSGIYGLLFGGFWGGIMGAIAWGLLAFFDDTVYLRGPMAEAFIYGLVIGGILGAIIGAIQDNRRTGIIIGVAIGLLIALRLVYDGGINIFIFAV